jgi:(p)ppGpp synthase/HD superfamily hydrolase
MNYEQKARQVVTEVFKDKTDIAGRPYIEHLETVCATVDSDEDEVKAIALLHDIVEDFPETWGIDKIHQEFNARIKRGVLYLTKGLDEYGEYIDFLANNPDAVIVKLADLRHNMDITRLKKLRDQDIERLKKYHAAFVYLSNFS